MKDFDFIKLGAFLKELYPDMDAKRLNVAPMETPCRSLFIPIKPSEPIYAIPGDDMPIEHPSAELEEVITVTVASEGARFLVGFSVFQNTVFIYKVQE